MKNNPVKYLSFGLKKKAGKNNSGKRVVKSKGFRRSKRKYRIIDFYRINYKESAFVLRIEYDPNRTANIALICYKNGILSYIIASEGMVSGYIISHKYKKVGIVQKLSELKPGSFISCLELRPNFGAKLIRAAGCFGIIIGDYKEKVLIRLPSGEERLLKKDTKAVLGLVSNVNNKYKKKKKAGSNILLGKKPRVRGVAKNCVDHPHGGGRGKKSKWATPVNFTRRVLKGVSLKKKKNNNIFRDRKWKKNR